MNHVIAVLKQMPQGLRGFTINVGSFVNSTYNLQLATEIHCQTGLNFILDTSRNGGKLTLVHFGCFNFFSILGLFSERHLEEINECTYDPPYVGKGATPGWAAGSTKQVKQITDGIPTETESYDSDYGYDDAGYEYDYRKKRKRRYDMAGGYGGKRIFKKLLKTQNRY